MPAALDASLREDESRPWLINKVPDKQQDQLSWLGRPRGGFLLENQALIGLDRMRILSAGNYL